MAEEIGGSQRRIGRPWVRRWLIIAAIGIAAVTCLLTAYLVFPEAVISHGLSYETYRDIEGLRLGMQDLEERHKKYQGRGGGGMGPIPVDLDRRFILFTVPYIKGDDNPDARSMCWAVLDTEREEIVGSLRIPKASDKILGMNLRTTTDERGPHISESGILSWSISCSGTLPAWWPGRTRESTDRSLTRSSSVSFIPASQSWTPTPANLDRSDASRMSRYFARMNRSLAVPGSSDELVVEHEWTQDEYPKPSFRRLLLLSRDDGTIRWAIEPEQFPSPGLQEGYVQIHIPPCELGGPIDWCVLVEQTLAANPAFWKLDLIEGHVSRLEIPIETTPWFPEVASDGQTVVFIDDGFVRYRYAGGGSSHKVREGNTAELTTWHPERGTRTLFQWWNMTQYVITIPGDRVFLLANRGRDTGLYIHIIPLNGASPRQVFP